MMFILSRHIKKVILFLILSSALLMMLSCSGGDKDNTDNTDNTEVTSGSITGTEDTQSGTDTETPEGEPYDGCVLTLSADGGYKISDNLFGVFLEDINFACDGGLYAEMIYNRSFEYGKLATLGGKQGWGGGEGVSFEIIEGESGDTDDPDSYLNENNTHFARVTNDGNADSVQGIYNTGYFIDLYITAGTEYKFSCYLRGRGNYDKGVTVTLEHSSKSIYASAEIKEISSGWKKYELTLTPDKTTGGNLRLCVKIAEGTVDMDMISLFPSDTFCGRENGLRADIAQMIADLNPRFLRFPGGCVIEGHNLSDAYSWKDSIGNGLSFDINGESSVGDVAARPLGIDIWADIANKQAYPYYMTYGLGFYEYFLFCEDLGCEPVPVVNCGLACQSRSSSPEAPSLTSAKFKQYVQDALDLVEFCRGGGDTYWGGIRIAMGHPEPFELTYLAVGNEQYGTLYNERFAAFRTAFIEAEKENPELYSGIKLIMANGLSSSSTDGWDVIKRKGNDYAALLDEHYYNTPSWFLMNNARYDSYERDAPTVFVGEYAAKGNDSEAAMAEAAYMTGLERNGDIVELAAYAPLLAYDTHTQWTPDLIWFNKQKAWGSVNYYSQKLFSTNQSDFIIKSELDVTGMEGTGALTGKIGMGTWSTMAKFDDVTVTDNETGEILYSQDFSDAKISDFTVSAGNFKIRDGILTQQNISGTANETTGDVLYTGRRTWTNYTLTMTAKKISGSEGFLIPFAVTDANNFWHWNIGGWNNTVSCLEFAENGVKSGQIDGTVKTCQVKTNHDYEIKIVLNGYNIKCYLDGKLMIDYNAGYSPVYSVCGEDDDDYIIKLVNVSKKNTSVKVDMSCFGSFSLKADIFYIDYLSQKTINNESSCLVYIKESELDVTEIFEYELPRFTAAVIRIPKKQ